MARPRSTPTPEQQKLLDDVKAAADELAEIERLHVEPARAKRDKAMLAAVQAGVDKTTLAAAAGIARQNVYAPLKALGYDPNAPH